jgi:hypothetical protein
VSSGVPWWARLLAALLALQVIALVVAAGAAGSLLLGSASQSARAARTLPAGPTLALHLAGFGNVDCRAALAAGRPCAASQSSPRGIGAELRVVPGDTGGIVVEQDAQVRAAGPALARQLLAAAAVRDSSTAAGLTLSTQGWNGWDPRLLQAQSRVTIRVPRRVVLLAPGATPGATPTPTPAPGSAGNPPNAPNAPNPPNAPTGRAGQSVAVAPGSTHTGDAAAWQGNVTVDGEVTGNVSVVGGNATINGRVDGAVHVWNGTAVIAGSVGQGVEVSGGQLTVAPQGNVGGEVRVWRPPAPVTIYGTVAQDLSVVTGGLEIAQGATAGRNVTVWTPGRPVKVEGAVARDLGVSGGDVQFGPQASLGGRAHVWHGSCSGAPCASSGASPTPFR